MANIFFRNCLGTFVFTQQLKLLKHDPLGKDLSDEIGARPADDRQVLRILEFFRGAEWLRMFPSKGIEGARKAILDSFSRDQLISSTIAYLDDLSKVLNMLTKRLRDVYYEVFPEPAMRIRDNAKFVELCASRSPKELMDDLHLDGSKAMLAPLQEKDWDRLHELASRVHVLYQEKLQSEAYLEALMQELCPNVTILAGPTIGARLLQLAGSLRRLSSLPAGTVQVLGAETAMFRHMRNKRYLPPKYGILHEHPAFASAPKHAHGKIARALADKIAIAAKVDYFKGAPVGAQLKAELDKKLAAIMKTRPGRRKASSGPPSHPFQQSPRQGGFVRGHSQTGSGPRRPSFQGPRRYR